MAYIHLGYNLARSDVLHNRVTLFCTLLLSRLITVAQRLYAASQHSVLLVVVPVKLYQLLAGTGELTICWHASTVVTPKSQCASVFFLMK
jgi:hypothetical protein